MKSFVRISFVSAALLVACGATVAELHAREASSAALAACRTSAEILCKRVGECAPDYVRFFFATDTSCLEEVTLGCLARYEGPGASDAPAPCNAAANAPCSVLADPERGVWNGPVDALLSFCEVSPGRFENLASCLRDGDCASGWCEVDHEGGACDRCGLTAGEGEACNPRARCRAGLRCGHDDRCERIPDEPLGKLGDPCKDRGCDLTHRYACGKDDDTCGEVEIASPGEPCTVIGGSPRPGDRYCDAHGWCGDAGVCEPRATLGEPCGSTSACHWTLECVDGTCRPPPARTSCTPL